MKKAKIMLLAIAVLATVGGALAFKVKKFGNIDYCYLVTTTQPPNGACILSAEDKEAQPFFDIKIYYTTTTNADNCTQAHTLTCSTVGDFHFEQ